MVKRAVRDSAGDADKLNEISEVLSEAAAKIGEVASASSTRRERSPRIARRPLTKYH